jgi:triosephosphate isomerase
MTSPIRKLIAGNWKMFGLGDALGEAEALSKALKAEPANCRVALCPPATLISRMVAELKGGPVEVGAQDCHAEPCGAFTGDISAEMLRDAGAHIVILGHSERRTLHHETDTDVALKVSAALRAGLEPIVCVGETLVQRKSGDALRVVVRQVRASLPPTLAGHRFAVAYEPIWAIGSGLTPSIAEIEAVHLALRDALEAAFPGSGAPILYGGSVKANNAAEILAAREVGGALVGGASLKAVDFLPIVRAE